MMNHSYDFSPVVLFFSYFWRCFKMERLEPEHDGFENANLLLIRGPSFSGEWVVCFFGGVYLIEPCNIPEPRNSEVLSFHLC